MKKPEYVELSEVGNEAPLKTPRGLNEVIASLSNSLTMCAASRISSAPSFEDRGSPSESLDSGIQFLVFSSRFSDCIVLGHDPDQGWTSETTRCDHRDGGGEPQWHREHRVLRGYLDREKRDSTHYAFRSV